MEHQPSSTQPDNTERVMVASFLDKVEPGQEFESLPSHMTYVSWFNLPTGSKERFMERVHDVTIENRAPVIKGGNLRLFTDNDGSLVAVRRIPETTEGFNVINGFAPHAAFVEYAKFVDPDFDDKYFGLNWTPHITDTPDRQFQQDEVAQLDNLTVIRREAEFGKKIIERVFKWGNL